MDQEFRIPTKSQERVQNRDIIHDCISNFAGHNCGQELKYSCSCKVGLTEIICDKKHSKLLYSHPILWDFWYELPSIQLRPSTKQV